MPVSARDSAALLFLQSLQRAARLLLLALLLAVLLAACNAPRQQVDAPAVAEGRVTAIADLAALELAAGEPLRVVATTSLIGDAARRVGGDALDLLVLLPPGRDPHAYNATPQDMIALADAHLVLINGVGLEESLLPALESIEGPLVVSVNEGVLILGSDSHEEDVRDEGDHAHDEDVHDEDDHDHAHAAGDPHTWQAVDNVRIWVANLATALGALDPVRADVYAANAAAYDSELAALYDEIVATLAVIPAERRVLITDHNNMAYFAQAYDFTILGSVIPSFSSMATISAQEMAALQDQIAAHDARAIFTGNTLDPRLARQLAADTGVEVVALYTDSLSAADGPAPDYVTMMRYNAARIAAALQ